MFFEFGLLFVYIGEMLYTNSSKARKQASPMLKKSMVQVNIHFKKVYFQFWSY